jgi:hypothetical protein
MPINDTLLFQHVHSNSECMQWVAATLPLTLEYCFAWKMDYQLVNRSFGISPNGEWGHWAVPELIREFMDLGYEKIIYLDADCVIVDSTVDFRSAFLPDFIGAVWHDLSVVHPNPDWSHFNVGALYIDNSVKVRHFIDLWLAGFPGTQEFPWLDQGVFGQIGAEQGIINKLDNRWNAGHVSPSDHMIVHGLHGFPKRYKNILRSVEATKASGLKGYPTP